MNLNIVIIDCGSGNLRSIYRAVEKVASGLKGKVTISLTSDPMHIKKADMIILPGQGAFAYCKNQLAQTKDMIDTLREQVIIKAKPFLGICVGMQLMCDQSYENGLNNGFGWISGEVKKMSPDSPYLKVPHMGWNALNIIDQSHSIFKNIEQNDDVYFVHSYAMVCQNEEDVLANTHYGDNITAVVGKDNFIGMQFHPEKSHYVGLTLLKNFLCWRP